DLVVAAQWYKKAATEGDADAQYELGDMYKQGTGVEQNNSLAIKWFRKAANQGHEAAKRRLGGCRIC
ncbi:tetratricopeptide repeat protein, partial [Kaarinaea lacus]